LKKNIIRKWKWLHLYIHLLKGKILRLYFLRTDRLKNSKRRLKNEKNEKKGASLPAQDFLGSLKGNEAYKGIDIDREFGKCRAWCDVNKKTLSQRRFVNWLNRVEKPIVKSMGTPQNSVSSDEQIKRWKAEASPMPEDCRKQLQKLAGKFNV
jgi:hypothetical protein